MYCFPEMLELGLKGKPWKSDAHRVVAEKLLLANPRINTLQLMIDNLAIIQSLSEEKVKRITLCDALYLGILV